MNKLSMFPLQSRYALILVGVYPVISLLPEDVSRVGGLA